MTGTVAKNEFTRQGYLMGNKRIQNKVHSTSFGPIPANAIDSNQGGTINQNKGYIGYEKNIPPLTVIDDQQ